jgi:hypothetical protein
MGSGIVMMKPIGLEVFYENTASITFPVDGVTLNSLVEGELGCFVH